MDQPGASGQTRTSSACVMGLSLTHPDGLKPLHLFISLRPRVSAILFYHRRQKSSLSLPGSHHRNAPPSALTHDCQVPLLPTRRCRSEGPPHHCRSGLRHPPRHRSSPHCHPQARRRQISLGVAPPDPIGRRVPDLVCVVNTKRIDDRSRLTPPPQSSSSTLSQCVPPTSTQSRSSTLRPTEAGWGHQLQFHVAAWWTQRRRAQ
jgi:hypothetical protein